MLPYDILLLESKFARPKLQTRIYNSGNAMLLGTDYLN